MSKLMVVTASSLSAGAKPGSLAIAAQDVRQITVSDLHPLGLSGRSGGVDHIREIFGPDARSRVLARRIGDGVPISVQTQKTWRRGLRLVAGRASARWVRTSSARRVQKHEGQPIGGKTGVQRDIRPAGLEDSQQARRPFRATARRRWRPARPAPRPASADGGPTGWRAD